MKATTKEFREFLLKQNAFALAIGVVIGAAIGKVVSGIVEDVLMPVIAWRCRGRVAQRAAHALRPERHQVRRPGCRIIDFLFIAIVVFLLAKAFLEKPAAAPATKSCPQCLELILRCPEVPGLRIAGGLRDSGGRVDFDVHRARRSRHHGPHLASAGAGERAALRRGAGGGAGPLDARLRRGDGGRAGADQGAPLIARELGLSLDYRKPEAPQSEAPQRYALTLIARTIGPSDCRPYRRSWRRTARTSSGSTGFRGGLASVEFAVSLQGDVLPLKRALLAAAGKAPSTARCSARPCSGGASG